MVGCRRRCPPRRYAAAVAALRAMLPMPPAMRRFYTRVTESFRHDDAMMPCRCRRFFVIAAADFVVYYVYASYDFKMRQLRH